MKIPEIRPPQYVMTSAVQAVRAAIDDAVRLGLTWRLRPGTVRSSEVAAPESVPVVVDGDSTLVQARSMVGALESGQRVWCVQVPPAGIYVLGVIGERRGGGRAKVRRVGNQSVSNNTNTLATFTESVYDDHGYWDGSGTLTVPAGLGGLYSVTCNASFATNATGSRAVNILQSGTREVSVYDDTHSASNWREINTTHLLLAEGDTVQMEVFQTSGAPLNLIGTASAPTNLAIARIQAS